MPEGVVSEELREAAYYLVGVVVTGASLGVAPERVSLEDETVWWKEPVVVLEKRGDFLDLVHREATIEYGGCLAEGMSGKRTSMEINALNIGAHKEAAARVYWYLDSWREDHPEVVAYVEEWLDLCRMYDVAAEILSENLEVVDRLADLLLRVGRLDSDDVLKYLSRRRARAYPHRLRLGQKWTMDIKEEE